MTRCQGLRAPSPTIVLKRGSTTETNCCRYGDSFLELLRLRFLLELRSVWTLARVKFWRTMPHMFFLWLFGGWGGWIMMDHWNPFWALRTCTYTVKEGDLSTTELPFTHPTWFSFHGFHLYRIAQWIRAEPLIVGLGGKPGGVLFRSCRTCGRCILDMSCRQSPGCWMLFAAL